MLVCNIMLKQLVVIVVWIGLGTLLGVVGVFASSHIPVVVLGWVFGGVGAFLHALFLAFNKKLQFWRVGCLLTIVAGAIILVWVPLAISQFAIPSYFVFGSCIYLALQEIL